jgi:hypothetical protein
MPGAEDSAKKHFARDINLLVKKYRGVNRPFVTLLVEDNGQVTILSNMDKHAEKVSLLSQVSAALKKAQ